MRGRKGGGTSRFVKDDKGNLVNLDHVVRISGSPVADRYRVELANGDKAFLKEDAFNTIVQEATKQELEERARLGVNDDKRKANLAKDSRLAQIQKIAGVEMMPTQQLRDFENKLFALKACFQLGRPDLESDPLCPHCGFRPAEEPAGGTAKKL